MRVYRICRAVFAADMWSGEGAWRYGGRWNHRGTRVIYASSSVALAALEYFVNLEPNLAPEDLISGSGELDDSAIAELSLPLLPEGWNRSRPEKLREIGDEWVRQGGSAGLRVPSAAVGGDWNLLLNPAHPAFAGFHRLGETPFRFDTRMFQKRQSH
ncbi:MAG TPA: RES family NAD+ phosphorylase [Terriglobales bacterium]|jgi:RES domain-containing protein